MPLNNPLKESENDFNVSLIKNQLKNSNSFEKLKRLDSYKELEKIITEGSTENRSVIDCLKEHPSIIHYAFILHVILNNKKTFKLLPIMQSIKNEHTSIFYFFLKEILLKNSSKLENSPTKTLFETILNTYKEE